MASCDPLWCSVTTDVGQTGFWANRTGLTGIDGFKTEGKGRRDLLEVIADDDTGETAFEEGGVHGGDGGGKVFAGVLILDSTDGTLGWGDAHFDTSGESGVPAIMAAAGEGAFIVEIGVKEGLRKLSALLYFHLFDRPVISAHPDKKG
jgi:hypothetical protein